MSCSPSFTSRVDLLEKCVQCFACFSTFPLSKYFTAKSMHSNKGRKVGSLQNSDFRGKRHVSQKTKRIEQAAREREEFLKELAQIRAKASGGKQNE
jgi:hypothetical protein